MNGVGIIKSVWQDLIIRTKQVLEFPVEDLFFKKTVTEIAQSSEVIDWDEDIPLSAEESYQAMRRALQRTQGFSLFFVRCSPIQAERLIDKIQNDLPQKQFKTLMLENETENLYDLVANLPDKQNTNILFIRGLEHSLLRYEEKESLGLALTSQSKVYGGTWEGIPRILGHLNLSRERFRDSFAIAFVFLLPEFALRYFIRRAPDFFDWRSGIYEFPLDQDTLSNEIYRIIHQYRNPADYQKFTQKELQEKLAELKAYLSDSPNLEKYKASELWFEMGLVFAVGGEQVKAISAFDRVLQFYPDKYDALYNKGVALEDLGRYEEAITAYDNVLKIRPSDYEAWNSRGLALFNLDRYEEAIFSFRQGLKFKEDDYQSLHNLAIILFYLGRYEEAILAFEKILEIKPDDYQSLYKYGSLLKNLGKLEEASLTYFNTANSLFNIGKYEEAITAYDNALEFKPNSYNALYKRGNALFNLSKYEEAILVFEEVLTIEPNDYQLRQKLGTILKERGNTEEARVAYFKEGEALFKLGKYEQALTAYDNALQFKSDYYEALYQKGNAFFNLSKYKEAIIAYDNVLKFKPDYYEAFYQKGNAFFNLSKYKEAIIAYDNVLKFKPDYHKASYNRGNALGNLGRLKWV